MYTFLNLSGGDAMFLRYATWVLAGACFAVAASAQTTKVDFGKDVLPILRQNCFGCHGPSQQMAGLRLDRRSSVFKSGMRRVVPGSIENSFLFHRISGGEYGLQMPPTGPLHAEQIAVLQAWIEQGAPWPDALANEADLPPANPKAVAMVEALRTGDRQTFLKAVAEDAKLLNARGPEGSTPFMYAVLYGDAALLEQLLQKGANANAHNDAKATPVMWSAITDLAKMKALVAHGADVNAKSDDSHTALMIAAGRPANTAMVKFLLEHGANPNPNANPMGDSSPLIQAALAGDVESMQMLIAHGADVKGAAPMALTMAITSYCDKCTDLLVKQNLDKDAYTFALLNVVGYVDARINAMLVQHGADVNAVDPLGRTALHYAAISDLIPADTVKLLIDHGANVNATSAHKHSGDSGLSVLDIARMNGKTPIVDLLLKAGAKSTAPAPAAPKPQPVASVREAVERSIPVLQRGDAGFTAKSGCISCHNESVSAMAMGLARKNGYRVDEHTAAQQLKVNAAYIEHQRDTLHQGFFAAQAGGEAFGDTFGPSVLGYILVGLDAEHYKADLNTDAVAMYLRSRQAPDGEWQYPAADLRQPICLDYMGQTALCMRALQLYAPKVDKASYDKAVQLAASWLAEAKPRTDEDRLWQLQGLAWAGRTAQAAKVRSEVAALQRPDGGWAQMASLASDPYATGRALVALHTAGMPVADPVYKRGVEFLLKNQMGDGSWYVKTRALGLQPFFDSGFPHGVNQAISSASSAWATMALTFASGNPGAGAAE
jgi:ankyrin repeat protein